MISSDIVLTDHTSLCINYALLGKPMLFYMPTNGYQASDVLDPLVKLYPRLDDLFELNDRIQQAQQAHDPEELYKVMNRFVSYQGRASERINMVFDRFLK